MYQTGTVGVYPDFKGRNEKNGSSNRLYLDSNKILKNKLISRSSKTLTRSTVICSIEISTLYNYLADLLID